MFNRLHSETLPSAQERYINEIKRVTKVLDGVLAGKEYLVGGRYSFADLAFVPWYWLLEFIDPSGKLREELNAQSPNWKAWDDRLNARPAVKKLRDQRQEMISK